MALRHALLIALLGLPIVPARADDEAKARAAAALAEQARALSAKAAELEKIAAAAAGATVDDPKLGEQLSSLAAALKAFKDAGGEEAKALPLLSRVARLVYDVRIQETGGRGPDDGLLVDLASKPKTQPLGKPFLDAHLGELRGVADEAAALAGVAPAGAERGLRQEETTRPLAQATDRVSGALAGLSAPFATPGVREAVVPEAVPVAPPEQDKSAVVSRYDRRARPRYDHAVYVDQLYLKALGYEAGTPDGKHGPTFDAAIRKFKKDFGAGFSDDGDVTSSVRANLRNRAISKGIDIPTDPLPPMTAGPSLTLLHYRLNRALGSDLAASSKFGKVALGPYTRRRIAEFQRAHELEPTGEIDQKTWEALGAEVAKKNVMPVEETEDKRSVEGARVTVYYPGHGSSRREGPPHDRFGQSLCTAEKYMRGGCDAITVAIDQRLQVRRGTPVDGPELQAAYMRQCLAAGLPCDRPARFQISDTGACSSFNGDGHIDVATESTETDGFGRAFDLHGATLTFPQGLPRDASLAVKCGRSRRRRRSR